MERTKDKILSSLLPVVAKSAFVTIDEDRVRKVAKEFVAEVVPPWDNDLQLLGTAEETAQYYFFLDSINFCFWAPKGETRWEYPIDGEWVGGYYAYSRAIKDAFLRDGRFFDSQYLSAIPEEAFRSIFAGGRSTLLLVEERLAIIRKNFSILTERYGGSVLNLLEEADHNADKIVQTLVENFPTFRDYVSIDGKDAYFLKRAQIFPSDLHFTGLKQFRLKELENLTAFADYKLPQVLESLGVIRYAPELDADIKEMRIIPAGSRKEVELRASTVVAIERIQEEVRRLGGNLTTQELDWILWIRAKQTDFEKPHHRTLTTFY